MTAQKSVTIYSTPTCHFCHAAKEFFAANKIAFTEHNVASDLASRKEMIEKSGQMGVPVIDIGGEIVVGYDEERLRELLVPAAA
jgi:glutaredoxin-like YruB-family protein